MAREAATGSVGVAAAPRLDGGRLVHGEHELPLPQGLPLPAAGVEVEDPGGLGLELRGPGEDPAPEGPRTNGVLGEPPPDRGVGDRGHDLPSDHLCPDVSDVHSESGSPSAAGSSQAIASTSTTTCGGKDRWPSPPGPLLQPGKALLEEPPPPLGHDLHRERQPIGDLCVLEVPGCHEDDLRPDHLTIRCCILCGSPLQDRPFFLRELDDERTPSGHTSSLHEGECIPLTGPQVGDSIPHRIWKSGCLGQCHLDPSLVGALDVLLFVPALGAVVRVPVGDGHQGRPAH